MTFLVEASRQFSRKSPGLFHYPHRTMSNAVTVQTSGQRGGESFFSNGDLPHGRV